VGEEGTKQLALDIAQTLYMAHGDCQKAAKRVAPHESGHCAMVKVCRSISSIRGFSSRSNSNSRIRGFGSRSNSISRNSIGARAWRSPPYVVLGGLGGAAGILHTHPRHGIVPVRPPCRRAQQSARSANETTEIPFPSSITGGAICNLGK